MRDTYFTLDCDGVLLDWSKGFAKWLNEVRGRTVDPEGPCSYDMQKWVGAECSSQVSDWIRQFNDTTYFGALEPCVGAKEAIAQIAASGAKISVVTSCGLNALTHSLRRDNLYRVFGDVFSSVECLPLGGSKVKHLAKHASAKRTIWVEDNLTHAISGMNFGFECYMIRHRHNVTQEPSCPSAVRWVDGLIDVVSLVSEGASSVEKGRGRACNHFEGEGYRFSSCDGKESFERSMANFVARKVKNPRVVAYQCNACGHWHVGQNNKPKKRLNRRK